MATSLRPGRLVKDSKGRQAITLERQGRDLDGSTRWRLMLMEGGTLVEAESSLVEVGTVNQQDFLRAIDTNRAGRRELAQLFPDHVKTVLGSG